MYEFLDVFFVFFHSAIIIFNLFGWIWKKTRKANLILLLLTACSWFVLGIWYGIGYCPLTDWHWNVLRILGKDDLPNSYVKYLADRITGLNFNSEVVDVSVVALLLLALTASVYVNIRQVKRNRQGSNNIR